MASTKVEMEKNGDQELKHLGFVRMMAINALVCVSYLYEYAKKNSGPLKSPVRAIENAVTTVVGPVYRKFKDLPDNILLYLDGKVDEGTHKFKRSAPPLAKKVVGEAYLAVQKASKVAKDFVQEAQVSGLHTAISHAGALSKQIVVSQMAFAWYKIDHCPPLHGFTKMAAPTIAAWSKKYNKIVLDLTAEGHKVFGYLPLVPVQQLAKAYKQVEAGVTQKENATTSGKNE